MGYNTTGNGIEWYQGTRWAYALESTFARGTSTYVPFFDANGQVTQSANLYYNSSAKDLYSLSGGSSSGTRILVGENTTARTVYFGYWPSAGATYRGLVANTAYFGAGTGATQLAINTNAAIPIVFFTDDWQEKMRLTATGSLGIGTASPQRMLHVAGEARITDLTTDPPTRIVGADADGDLGALALSGLSISGGTLTGQNIGNTNLSLTSNRTLTGGAFDLRLDTDVTVGDSLRVITLPNHTDPDSISTVKGGVIGKKKFLMPASDAYDGTSTGFFNDDFALGYQTSGNNYFHLDYADTTGYWQKITANLSYDAYSGFYGTTRNGATNYTAAAVSDGNGNFIINFVRPDRGVVVSKFKNGVIGFTDIFQVDTFGTMRIQNYGTGTKEAADLGKTQSNYITSFATDGTVLDLERKRDTTIYVTDADYNFSAAITSANILNRYNRIIIYSKLSSGATSDNQIFLHTPSADFLQCEIIIYSNDASADSDATSIDFTTNGAVDGAGGTLSSYAMAPGQRVEIRVADDGGYKWFFN